MSIVIECKSCRKRRKAPEKLAGKRVRCKCGDIIAIPADALPPAEPAELDLSEVSLLSHLDDAASAPSLPTCPSCQAVLAEGAILCVQCGYNLQTGLRVGEAVDSPKAVEADSASPAMQRKKVEHKPMPIWIGSLAKLVIVLALVGGFGWGVWHIVQAVTFDPSAQLDDDLGKISPRMKVYDVVKALGRPPKEILTDRDPSESDNVVKFIPKKLFWSADFMEKYSDDDLKYGFSFIYKYTEREQLVIWFNSDGEVEYAEKHDPMKMLWGN